MAELSKTARQAMNAGAATREKKVISDEEYIKNLRYDVSNGIHATQEGAKALLREFDRVSGELAEAKFSAGVLSDQVLSLEFAKTALQAALEENEKLKAELASAAAGLRTLKNDLSRIQFPDTTGGQ